MKNLILVISNKNSIYSEFFFNTLSSHKNIQNVKLNTYDRVEKYFLAQNTRADYLKNPKFYCEKLDHNYQLSFRPFLKQFMFFFIIDKPKNVIKKQEDVNYYLLRLRRIYELIVKTNGRNKIFFEKQVYNKETYDACGDLLKVKNNFKLNKAKEEQENATFVANGVDDFYEKYKLKIDKYL
jgi:hypothetical protein